MNDSGTHDTGTHDTGMHDTATGWLFDGTSSRRWPVVARVAEGWLRLEDAEGVLRQMVAPGDLVAVDRQDDRVVVGLANRFGWRLHLEAPLPPAVAALLPSTHPWRDRVERVGLLPALGAGALGIALIAFVATHIVGWVVPLVPRGWATSVGESVVASVTAKAPVCHGRAGQLALAQLASRLYGPGTLPEPVTLQVIDSPVANAFAAPGGQVVVFRGLIDEAASGDEVAGVLAHELGHVRHRHALRSLVRALGIGIFIRSAGGDVGSTADLFLSLSSSRDYERQADDEALQALARADISPAALAGFFERNERRDVRGLLPGEWREAMDYLSTHPGAEERRMRFKNAAIAGRAYAPALSPAEWQALRAVCSPSPDKASR